MARLVWGQHADKHYEHGLDRGVLYIPGLPGVAWNGLLAVTEQNTGADRSESYLEGVRYRTLVQPGDFAAKIKAFSAPREFASCLGLAEVRPGFTLTGQQKTQFSFSYRTMVNEEDYKLHLVYDAMVVESGKVYTSLGEDVEPLEREWELLAVPPATTGMRPTAHLTLDSRDLPRGLLTHLETLLYGDATEVPRMPTQAELLAQIDNFDLPLQLPGLLVWLDSRWPVGLNEPRLPVGSSMHEWINLAETDLVFQQAVENKRPIYETLGIRFDGVDDVFLSPLEVLEASEITLYVRSASDVPVRPQHQSPITYRQGSLNGGFIHYRSPVGGYDAWSGASTGGVPSWTSVGWTPPDLSPGIWSVVASTHSDQTALYVDGVSRGLSSPAPYTPVIDPRPINIGAGNDYGSQFFFDGLISQVLIYAGKHSAETRMRIETWLMEGN